jgi:DNA-binding Xre family transcriptional regulator
MKTFDEYRQDPSSLRIYLEEWIYKRSISITKLAQEMGITRQVLSRLLKADSRMKPLTIIKICNWINKQEHNSI